MVNKIITLENERATLNLGRLIAQLSRELTIIYLYGDLGVGKTTLIRGFLQALGHEGNVKSPTYTLVEPYILNGNKVYHIDLFRITNPKELEFIGIWHYFDNNSICLVEWPQKGIDILPDPDIEIYIFYQTHGRKAYINVIPSLEFYLLEQLVHLSD